MFRKEGIFFPDEISRLLASPFALKTLTDEPVLTNTHVHDEELIPQFTNVKFGVFGFGAVGLTS